MAVHRVVIDCDPGQDDAVALLLAMASPEDVDLLGITVVAGNVPLALTARNARQVCELAGRTDVPVFAGAECPLVRVLDTAEVVHGKSGMDGADLPEPRMPLQAMHAADFLAEAVMSEGALATLVALGPLTNIALALRRHPAMRARIARICLMGGAAAGGNTTPVAEFNIHVDPEAAAEVFGSGVPIVMFGLDVTHRVLVTPQHVEALRAIGNRTGATMARMLDFYTRFDRRRYGWKGGPLHDPCVVAWLLQPDLFGLRPANVEVETERRFTTGQTVVDWHGISRRPPNAMVAHRADPEGFFELLFQRIARLP
ncbi:MAG: nucleoside hydrolase [Acetobacterales bacterium]